jgi:glycosyltransferase involved in cell wall biosynthesis
MDNPLVSIIIPAYNRADLIGETLDSVLAQTYLNWECILVDDGSTDDTKAVVKQYVDKDARFILVERPNEHKPGGNGARNYGFNISKGKYIQWFDSDDLMHPELLKRKTEIFKKNSQLKSVISQMAFFVGNLDNITFITKLNHQHKLYEDVITYQTALYQGSIMFEANFIKNTKEFWDEDLSRAQEYEFFSRLYVKNEIETLIIKETYAFYRQHQNNISTQFNEGDRGRAESAFLAIYKIVTLLIEKNKLSNRLTDYFYKGFNKHISRLIIQSKEDIADNYAKLNFNILKENKRNNQLFLFKTMYFIKTSIPVVNHIFSINKETPLIRNIRINFHRVKKSLTQKGYLQEKLNK